jgi:hypothetical protein
MRRPLNAAANEAQFIRGIFNYCDRWCERCALTARCRVYAMEREARDDSTAQDLGNPAFWERIESTLKAARDLLIAWAGEEGIDLTTLDMEEATAEGQQTREQVEHHELTRAARQYAVMVNACLDEESVVLEPAGTHDEPVSAADAVEVIRWYQHLIEAKIQRALGGLGADDEDPAGGCAKDSDGSAKVALIGMDRSLSAWALLRACLPERRADTRALLLHLERLRRRTEQTFPNARSFVRPGFDSLPRESLH